MGSTLESKFNFIIKNNDDLQEAEKIISEFQIKNVVIKPYFNFKNLSFFKKNVFVNKNDIIASKPKQKDIFARMVINPLNFGKITVLANGDIYANINEEKLGNIKNSSFYDIVYKELYGGKSWRKVRSEVVPCKDCVFDLLCPPITNFEYVAGRNNLCNIWKTN